MQDFAQWSLDTIREEGSSFSWLEEQRFDWATTTSQALEQILNGKTIILITDRNRKWLETYILCLINGERQERPLIPIISIDSMYKHYNGVSGSEMINVVEDMISLSHKQDYFFWYIGKGDDKRADIAKRKDNSYFWIFDEDYLNAFNLRSYDKSLDIKLLQLYRLFDASLNSAMFGEVDVNS
ncbi:HobA family DNA replication regulator [Candidatus Sulfurimonas baltica]|uniref:HobA family DNA replication regulator n=1 Tax=Candidatus Sulfurimonas baltica TaxID=2740404 RepID=A0A7S7LTY8_9BACT|nr:HobA family DNA replication regulator [Candidatus Sulfurimonas baltica]QOY51471.1 HobA family DNA replication regulator [Candidatus Sulfurimonas baltica]